MLKKKPKLLNPRNKNWYVEKKFTEDDKYIPIVWEGLTKIKIIDPDGWRNAEINWGEEINWETWYDLMTKSTIREMTEEEIINKFGRK